MTPEAKIYQTLRIAVAMCFIGHGAFGIITKEIWCNYFGVFGIDREASYMLMPWVGIADILLGFVILFYPSRFVPAWLVFWGLLTALLRPLSGEPFAEFVERAGNYGAPFVLLMLAGRPVTLRNLLLPMKVPTTLEPQRMEKIIMALRFFSFLLLAGHGWLNLLHKPSLLDQYSALGFSSPASVATLIGAAEVLAALWILVKPVPSLLIVFFIWKMASETLYPHYLIFEWIERGGSYGCILALWIATSSHYQRNPSVLSAV